MAAARDQCISYGDQSAQLKDIREVRPDVAAWSFSSQQATLRRLNRAFAGFFRRVNAGQAPGYPRFKSAHRFDSVEWPKDGDGCRWQPETRRVYLQGIGHVKVTVHRQVQGRVKTIQVRREGRRWMLILSCDQVPTRPLAAHQGRSRYRRRDRQLRHHLRRPAVCPTLATGGLAAARLATAQQVLARKQRGSNNRRRARATVAARHRKLANQRRNFHHHTARALVVRYDLLVVEDLKIRNLVRRPPPRPDPDHPGRFLANRAAAKTGLHRSIHDAGWAQFVSILRAKAEEAGRVVIDVDPRHTSDRCEACGHTARRTAPAKRCSPVEAAGTPSTPTSTRHATSSGLDWPVSQPPRLREKKLAAPAVSEVTLGLERRSPYHSAMTIRYEWRGEFTSAEANALHAECFGHPVLTDAEWDWRGQVEGHSLGWVCARDGEELVGFVNVAWDGVVHAFVLDTMVAARARRHGVGTRLVEIAVARGQGGRVRVAARRLRRPPAGLLLRRLRVHPDQRRADRAVEREGRWHGSWSCGGTPTTTATC